MAMQSVIKSLQVLEAVAEHQPIRVGELTPMLGLPKSTVQRSLETLADAGWLRQVEGDLTRWALTSRAHSVVARSTVEKDLRDHALAPMQALRDATEETTHLFVPAGRYGVVVIERVDSRRSVRTVIPLGTVFPMAGSTAGIAMLARGPDDLIPEAITHARAATDNPFEADMDKINSQIEAARHDGYSCRLGWDKDVMGVGAAILDQAAEVVAGVSVSIPLSRFVRTKEKDWAVEVMCAAAAISQALGYQSI